jgi:hypothetical protein
MGKGNVKQHIWTVVEQGIWRIRTNQELRELYKDLDIVADMTIKKLEWTGQVERIDHARKHLIINWRGRRGNNNNNMMMMIIIIIIKI